jgi:hypothetical protein
LTAGAVLEGGCLCGAVRYRISGPIGPVVLCHCGQCRKAQGAAFAANAPVSTHDFMLLRGTEALTAYASSPGKWRSFCRHCGAPIHSRRDSAPEMLRLRLGSLDDSPATAAALQPAAHIHVASKAPWWLIADDLPQHAGVEPDRQ